MAYQFDLSKGKLPNVPRQRAGEGQVASIFVKRPAIDQETAQKCQRLIAGAVQLMHNRLVRLVQPAISQKQFAKFQEDVRAWSDAVIYGKRPFEDFVKWMDIAINQAYEPDPEDAELDLRERLRQALRNSAAKKEDEQA